MKERDLLIQRIENVSEGTFDVLALDIFRYQYTNNALYRQYCDLLGCDTRKITTVSQIPFLPIRFFKSHRVLTGNAEPELAFRSSGTSGTTRSTHYVCDPHLYNSTAATCFAHVFGHPIKGYRWLALLPSYLERDDASLVFMTRYFVDEGKPGGGFFLDDHIALRALLAESEEAEIPTILIGVSFALLEFVRKYPIKLQHALVVETGGMKGRTPELTREELHTALCQGFGVPAVYSEYGMTELLSQAWSKGDGRFQCGPTMRVYIRDLRDPFAHLRPQERGGIDCVDLANIDSCAFVQTEDVGMLLDDSQFAVGGRMDGSEARGCNLLMLNENT